MRRILSLTATCAALCSFSAYAEPDYGNTRPLPQAQHSQEWRDAGSPWKDAGRQFSSIWGDVSSDAKAIGPIRGEQWKTKPTWTGRPVGQSTPFYSSSTVQTEQYVPANPVYLPAEPQIVTVPYDSYSDPIPYVETTPTYQTQPTYEMVPVYGN